MARQAHVAITADERFLSHDDQMGSSLQSLSALHCTSFQTNDRSSDSLGWHRGIPTCHPLSQSDQSATHSVPEHGDSQISLYAESELSPESISAPTWPTSSPGQIATSCPGIAAQSKKLVAEDSSGATAEKTYDGFPTTSAENLRPHPRTPAPFVTNDHIRAFDHMDLSLPRTMYGQPPQRYLSVAQTSCSPDDQQGPQLLEDDIPSTVENQPSQEFDIIIVSDRVHCSLCPETFENATQLKRHQQNRSLKSFLRS